MEEKVKEIMGKVFGVDPAAVGEDSSPDTIDNWDSLRHMNLILALEEEFGVEIRDDQINEMLNYRLVVLTMEELVH